MSRVLDIPTARLFPLGMCGGKRVAADRPMIVQLNYKLPPIEENIVL